MADEPTGPSVDDEGKPETPAVQAVDKRKQRNRQYAALAIGAVGIVVAVVIARRNAANASTSTAAPTLGTGGQVASGPDNTAGTDLTGAFGATLSQLAAGQAAQTSALSGVNANLSKIQSELNAQNGHGPLVNPAPAPAQLPKLSASLFTKFLPGYGANAANIQTVGTVGAGGKYSGGQVTGGAPVYALEGTAYGPVWEQGFNMAQLPAGTKIGTPAELHNYVRPA